jgi:hypothetical protein
MKSKKSSTKEKKSGLKKWLASAALVLVILITTVVICVLTRLDGIVKEAIEKYGSRAAGTKVRVESVKIRLREGSGAISGLTVANPAGFEGEHAFILGEIGVAIDIRSLTKKVKIVNEILIRAPEIFVEIISAKAVNLDIIRKNLDKSATPKKSAPTKEDKAGPEPRLIIRRILFTNGMVHVKIAAAGGKEYRIALPRIEMSNLGGRNGATPDQITRQILGELCRRALAEVERKGTGLAIQKAKDAVKSQVKKEALGRWLR